MFAIGAVLSCLLNFAILRETRSDVLLARRAKRMTKETGKRHLCATDLQRKVAFFDSLRISLVRPFRAYSAARCQNRSSTQSSS